MHLGVHVIDPAGIHTTNTIGNGFQEIFRKEEQTQMRR